MTILVTGARGAVATELISLLRRRDLLVRPASSSPGEPATVRCDLTDPSTFPAALEGVDSVFLYAEPSHIDAFVNEAVTAGVEHIVLLSSSAVLAPEAEANPLAKTHADVEHALASAPVRSTLLRPGAFAGNALAWSWPVKSGAPVSLPYPGSYSDPIHEADLAETAAAVLADPALGGRAYTLTGPESLTCAEQIDILGRATGRHIAFRTVTREEWKAETAGYLSEPIADALLDWQRSNDGVPTETTADVEWLIGRPGRTFATWAQEHAAAFTP
ncbi:NAD-dependent epimerase [Planomonospora parontospora subsp. parontospora]|uniref:NAD-dependent epimerase n=2 Tax=Planomonospora parontospora TaxID=58119 RepID=A0AA37BFY8_9ACTN|nr:NAD(P)H-binding protein [Planomonospora parontospora]GGK65633.1 NAD-dependent epimerase [Planomonospora parontospora]GII08380.1 NAD-dependent epimerase [Planomonospora parontospora subsp. parontospora]